MLFNLFGKLGPELRSITTEVSLEKLMTDSIPDGGALFIEWSQRKIKTKGTLFSNRYFTHVTEQQMFEHW